MYRFPIGSDGVHLTAEAQYLKGVYHARAAAALAGGQLPPAIRWLGAQADGTGFAVWASAPTPLAFSTAIIGATANQGIKIVDDTGALTLSALSMGTAVLNPASGQYETPIACTLNRALGANPRFRYALDFAGSGYTVSSGASGNVFDTTSDTVEIDGSSYSLAHAAPPTEMPVFVVE